MVARIHEAAGLVPIHIGVPDPQRSAISPHLQYSGGLKRQARFQPQFGSVPWQELGVSPRWLGHDTSECAASINPSVFRGQGLEELERLIAGAQKRGEMVVGVTTLGNADGGGLDHLSGRYDDIIRFSSEFGSVTGRRLPSGPRITLAEGLTKADRDLGLRLMNRGDDAPWWALEPQQLYTQIRASGGSPLPLGGALEPILVDGLGEPVVAAWVPDGGGQRWYVVPDPVDWETVVAWLLEQALLCHVPDALRRARSPLIIDPDLESPAERQMREALEKLESSYDEERARLREGYRAAREVADPVRDGLLYGTGDVLEELVGTLLEEAGFQITRLDAHLGDTTSADLLVEYAGVRRLVEVKSSGGAAPEKLVSQLQRHLDTWPQLQPNQPVVGGTLIVNHQLKRDPHERSAEVYQRREFVDSLTVEVMGTRWLFDQWRAKDWEAIRAGIFGQLPLLDLAPDASVGNAGRMTDGRRKFRWRR